MRVGVFLLAVLASFNPCVDAFAAERPCYRNLVQYHWVLDLAGHSVKRVGKAKVAFVSCDEFPRDASDNLALEILSPKGKVIFRKYLFTQLKRFFDFGAGGKYGGGVRDDPTVLVTTALPDAMARADAKLRIRIMSLESNTALGEGAL